MTDYQAAPSDNTNINSARDVQAQILDAVLLVGSIFGVVGFIASLTIIAQIGWRNETIGFVIALMMVTVGGIFRKHLSYQLKSMLLIGALYTVAVVNLIGWGLIGASSIWFVVTVLMTMILHDMKRGLVVYGLVVLTIALVTALYRAEFILFDFDVVAYSESITSWLSRMIVIVLICATLVASVGRLIDALQQQLNATQRTAHELEQRTAALLAEIEKREQAEIALADAVVQLQDLDRMKDQFIDGVSHELRTPLANIQLYHQLLGLKPERAAQYLATLSKETERLGYIVEQMIHASGINYDMTLTTMVEIDVLAMTATLFDSYQPTIREKQIDLHIMQTDALFPTLAASEHMERVLYNVIDNAVKYTPTQGKIAVIAKQLIATDEDENNRICLIITNSSALSLNESAELLFERFYRGENSLQMSIPGAGLGLSIARQIIEKYGGSITVTLDDKQNTVAFMLEFIAVRPFKEILADEAPIIKPSL